MKKNLSSVKTKSVGNTRLLPHAKIPDPNNYRRFSFSSVNVTVSYDVCHAITTAYLTSIASVFFQECFVAEEFKTGRTLRRKDSIILTPRS